MNIRYAVRFGEQEASVEVAADATIGALRAAACDAFGLSKREASTRDLWGCGKLWKDGRLLLCDCEANPGEEFELRANAETVAKHARKNALAELRRRGLIVDDYGELDPRGHDAATVRLIVQADVLREESLAEAADRDDEGLCTSLIEAGWCV